MITTSGEGNLVMYVKMLNTATLKPRDSTHKIVGMDIDMSPHKSTEKGSSLKHLFIIP